MFQYITHSWYYLQELIIQKFFRTQKLKRQLTGTITADSVEKLRSEYGMDVEQELIYLLQQEIHEEIDKNGSLTWEQICAENTKETV